MTLYQKLLDLDAAIKAEDVRIQNRRVGCFVHTRCEVCLFRHACHTIHDLTSGPESKELAEFYLKIAPLSPSFIDALDLYAQKYPEKFI